MDENTIKLQINELIQIQGDLCPELFSKAQKLRPEVKETFLKIAEFSGEIIKDCFNGIELADILVCGGCASYLYNKHSEIDLVLLWRINPELLSADELEEKLKLINKGFPNRGFLFEIYGRNVNYVNYAIMPAGSGLYSVTQDKWLKFPERNHFAYSLNELYERFKEIDNRVNSFMVSLPKSEKSFLKPADCKKAENLYTILYHEALETQRESKNQEYDIEYQSFRCFRRLGNADKLMKYVRDSYQMYFA